MLGTDVWFSSSVLARRPIASLLSILVPHLPIASADRNTKFPILQACYDNGESSQRCCDQASGSQVCT